MTYSENDLLNDLRKLRRDVVKLGTYVELMISNAKRRTAA